MQEINDATALVTLGDRKDFRKVSVIELGRMYAAENRVVTAGVLARLLAQVPEDTPIYVGATTRDCQHYLPKETPVRLLWYPRGENDEPLLDCVSVLVDAEDIVGAELTLKAMKERELREAANEEAK